MAKNDAEKTKAEADEKAAADELKELKRLATVGLETEKAIADKFAGPIANPVRDELPTSTEADLDKLYRVKGLRNHTCKIKAGKVPKIINIKKGEITEVTAFEYNRLTNPALPEPIVVAVIG